ncbi:FAD-binding oxidoreductase [Salibacteraceae bacterium]|nr:FAD-binding oxidoreductase [Salibacteraceae bacterium]
MSTLIIGGGLAGICVAEQLSKLNEPFNLVQPSSMPSSTAVATGMFNPIVFKRLNLSWMVDILIPEMLTFYQSLEETLGIQLIEKHSLYKKIKNKAYEDFWNKRLKDPEYAPFMGEITNTYGEVKRIGTLDCALLQASYLSKLKSDNLLIETEFQLEELTIDKNGLIFNNETYDRVIFCEGAFAAQNPYFEWLPFKLCKGEWITIKTEEPVTDFVVNNVVNIIPLGNNEYKLSSTFTWEDLDWKTTPQAVDDLLKDFTDLFAVPFKVIDHKAAIRPTVADRRPYLGSAPENDRLFIFNGLGSKGAMLAPYFSKHLVNHIFKSEKLLPEVDIKRHYKRYLNRDENN